MDAVTLSQILSLYSWFPLVILLSIYLLIARFYHRFSGKRTLSWLFGIPVLLYGAAFIRYASIEQMSDDIWGNILADLAGVSLLLLSTSLFLQMRQHPKS